jgi:hypothetical protein
MLNLTCEIIIGDYVFTEVNAVQIRSGRNILTATATIVLPNIDGNTIGDPTVLDNAIAVDDEVEIKLGYDGENFTEFVGFVKEKRPNMPFTIVCEDAMRNMRTPFSKTYPSVKLKELIQELVPDVVFGPVPDVELTDFRVNDATILQVLMEIKNTYPGIDLYFRNGKLYAGLPYEEQGSERVYYHLQDTIIRHNLLFTKESDLRIRVRAVSTDVTGEKIEIIIGDKDGDSTTLNFNNLSMVDLKTQAEQKLKFLKIRGYKGNVVTWGIPRIKHGDIAQWDDRFYPERRTANFIDEVVVDFGANGFRRTLTPGLKSENR